MAGMAAESRRLRIEIRDRPGPHKSKVQNKFFSCIAVLLRALQASPLPSEPPGEDPLLHIVDYLRLLLDAG